MHYQPPEMRYERDMKLTRFAADAAPLFVEGRFEEVQETGLRGYWQAAKRRLRRADTLAMRVAVPPLMVWAVLYSMVEYFV